MKGRRAAALLVVLMTLLLPVAPAAVSPGASYGQDAGAGADAAGATTVTVTVTGALVNGTDGGAVPAGVTALLHLFGAASGAVATYEAVTDADGGFRFEDVSLPEPDGESSAALVADYGGTRYTQTLAPSELGAPLSLTVYEATQDVGVVSVLEQSIIIAGVDRATRRVAAVQLFTLENGSDVTLVPDLSAPPVIGQFSFLRFSLPAGATGLDVSTDLVGGEVIPVGTGFAITAPAPPGRHQVSFTYTAPYQGDTLAWRDNTLQGAGVLQALVPAEFGDIGVGGLAPAEPLTVGDVTYRAWRAEGLAPGAGVALTLSGLPEPAWWSRVGNPLSEVRFWYGAVPALVAAALAGLLLWGIFGRRHYPAASQGQSPGGRAV